MPEKLFINKKNFNNKELELWVHFSNLEILNLSNNTISDASPIMELEAPLLRQLDWHLINKIILINWKMS